MEFKTIEHSGRVHVVKNGVESAEFVIPSFDGYAVYQPEYLLECKSRITALEIIAHGMGDWYTVPQAAIRLAELGAVNKPPHPKTVCRWARKGQFPGAIRVRLPGRGGPWRIPEAALVEFTTKRR